MFDDVDSIWYRVSPAHGGLVFALPCDAIYADGIYHALRSDTWGQLRERLAADDFHDIITLLQSRANSRALPCDSDKFDPNLISEYYDGGFPRWAAIAIEAVLPFHITIKYGRRIMYDSGLDDFLLIRPVYEQSILNELCKLSYCVQRRDDIVFW